MWNVGKTQSDTLSILLQLRTETSHRSIFIIVFARYSCQLDVFFVYFTFSPEFHSNSSNLAYIVYTLVSMQYMQPNTHNNYVWLCFVIVIYCFIDNINAG